jgi:hypothetical protein
MHKHFRAVLFHPLEGLAKMVARLVDGLAQETLQPVPGSKNLRHAGFPDNAPVAIEGDAPVNLDAEVAGPGAAFVKRFQQLRMTGDTGASTDQFDGRAFIHIDVPPAPLQKCRGEQAGHRPADDDRATFASRRNWSRHRLDPHGKTRETDRASKQCKRQKSSRPCENSALSAFGAIGMPDWTRHAKTAPFKRNDQMLEALPTGLVAFPGSGISANLADKARKARKLGIPVWRHSTEGAA